MSIDTGSLILCRKDCRILILSFLAFPLLAKGHGDRPGFAPSVAEEASQWRRAGPLPSSNESPSRSGPSRGNSFMRSDSTSGFDNMDVAGGARSGFGSKFSAAPAGRDGPPHASRGRSFVEPSGEPGPADDASTWRTGKAPEAAPPRRGSNAPTTPSGPARAPSFRRDATDVDEKYASQERMGFGSKFTPAPAATPPPESPRAQRAGFGFGGDRRGSAAPSPAAGAGAGAGGNSEPQNWRSAKRPSQDASTASAAPPTGPSSPIKAERKKLELKARSTDPSTATASTSSPSSNRPSPFGEARPVDASEREKEIEERLRVRKEEEKAKREKEAQEKKEKSAADKTKSPPSGPKADRVSAAATTTDSQTSTSTQEATATATSEKDATPKQPSAPPANPWRKNWGDKPSENSSSPKTEESKPASTNSTSTTAAPATATTTDSKSEETSKSTSTTESSKPAPAQKTSAPTGAWGARKPSGHLAAEKEKEKENKEKEAKTNGDGGIAATVTETVKEVAEPVKEKAIELNESAEKFGHDG